MKYTLKLDIFYFSLNKITRTITRKVRGKDQTVNYASDEDVVFEDFFESLNSTERPVTTDSYMKEFITGFVKYYDNTFFANVNNTQAVSITEKEAIQYNSKDFTAWGIFKGGPKGMEFEVYNEKDAVEPENMIGSDNVTSLYYFYKIWIPSDSNVGILMVQSYTSRGCTALFKETIQRYFIANGYKPMWSKCIPKEYIEKYLKDGYINRIQVIHRRRDDKDVFDPVYAPITRARYSTNFTNFRIPFDRFVQPQNYKAVLKSQIAAIDTDFNPELDEVNIFYKDENGKMASAKLAQIEDILPTITLDDSLKDSETHVPKWDEVHEFTKSLLEDIKKQILYTPTLK